MQIDTTNNNIDSSALHKEAMKIAAAEFMGKDAQKQAIRQMMGKQNTRFDINLDNLRQFNQDLARYVTKNPIEAINIFESQLDRIVQDHSDN